MPQGANANAHAQKRPREQNPGQITVVDKLRVLSYIEVAIHPTGKQITIRSDEGERHAQVDA